MFFCVSILDSIRYLHFFVLLLSFDSRNARFWLILKERRGLKMIFLSHKGRGFRFGLAVSGLLFLSLACKFFVR